MALAALPGLRTLVRDIRSRADTPFRYETLPARPAIPLSLERPDGSRADFDPIRGDVLILHFWATWCPPCRTELPELLRRFRSGRAGSGVRFVAVAADRDWRAVSSFFKGEIPPEVMRDGSGLGAESYRVTSLPDTYIIVNGEIRYRVAGARNWGSRETDRFMVSVLEAGRRR